LWAWRELLQRETGPGVLPVPRLPLSALLARYRERRNRLMQFNVILIQPLLALVVGILILILPRLLNYLIALYLILIGLAGLFPHLFTTPGS
jgi:hypothetical protein